MFVTFRTDGSLQIGTGHVIRCLTLANALREKGAKCQFVCRDYQGHLMDNIRSHGFEVHKLPKPDVKDSFDSHLAHARWLGVDWLVDAQQTLWVLLGAQSDWLIVDHYALDYRWEFIMQQVCKRMMVIDDLADRQHFCDLLLDQNYGSSAQRYSGLISANCTQLHGPEFALIKPIYAQRRAKQGIRRDEIKKVFVYFGGGSDPLDLNGMAIRAFQDAALMNIDLDIVVGAGFSRIEELRATAAKRGRTRIHTQLSDLSELMINADLAVGAGGATTWERCCLGLPSIVISVAENQKSGCDALASDDLIQYLGCASETNIKMLREHVLQILAKPKRLRELSERSMRLVDGKGVTKVVEALEKRVNV